MKAGKLPEGVVIDRGDGTYTVGGRADDYHVQPKGCRTPGWQCSCPHYQHRCAGTLSTCRHIDRLAEHLRCPRCQGTGELTLRYQGYADTGLLPCRACEGTGRRQASPSPEPKAKLPTDAELRMLFR